MNDTTELNYTHMLEYLMKRKVVVLSVDGIVDTFMLPAAENNTYEKVQLLRFWTHVRN